MKIELIETQSESILQGRINKFCESVRAYDVRVQAYMCGEECYYLATITYEDYDDSISEVMSLKSHIKGLESELAELKKG